MNIVYTENYILPEININEVLHYTTAKSFTNETRFILNDCIKELGDNYSPKICYIKTPVSFLYNCIDFGFMNIESADLRKNLSGYDSAVIFVATIGIEIDRLIKKYSSISPVKALMFQAIGTERIERLCDLFTDRISEREYAGNRFSPGYGDLPLTMQKDIIRALNCAKNIGVTLTDSLLMSPTKSVTAIIGTKAKKVK